MFIVDHLLDILTGNEHRKTSHYIAEQKMLRKEDELLETTYNDLEEIEEVQEKDKQVKIENHRNDYFLSLNHYFLNPCSLLVIINNLLLSI